MALCQYVFSGELVGCSGMAWQRVQQQHRWRKEHGLGLPALQYAVSGELVVCSGMALAGPSQLIHTGPWREQPDLSQRHVQCMAPCCVIGRGGLACSGMPRPGCYRPLTGIGGGLALVLCKVTGTCEKVRAPQRAPTCTFAVSYPHLHLPTVFRRATELGCVLA